METRPAILYQDTMRILHTADWHLGQTLQGYDRIGEQRAVLQGLIEVVRAREVDALVLAGDVFDHQNPSGDAQRLFYETLVALKGARPALTIVVTAGNHDAAGRLEAPAALLRPMGVHVVGSVVRRDGIIDAARHLIPLCGPGGEIAAHVLAVSYPTAACLPPFAHVSVTEGTSPIIEATRALYAEIAERSGVLRTGLPFVVTGHLHVAGGIESEGAERRILVGGQHAVPPSVFPEQAAYVALGHLHRAQAIGRATIRYSGSLLPLSAAELEYGHGVSLVTLDGRDVLIEHIDLPRPVPFLRLPATGDMRLEALADHLKALELPAGLPLAHRPFVQVRLQRVGLAAGYRAEADRIAEDFPVRLVDLRVGERTDVPGGAMPEDPLTRLTDIAPEDIFRMAFERKHGAAPEVAHLEAFHRALAASASGEA